jgi:hypothetical protein
MYFNKEGIFSNTFVSTCFTKRRFNAISSNLHFVNTAQYSQAERNRRNSQNGFWAVDSLIDVLTANYRRYYLCGQFIDVDEMCIGFKGRHRCRCYNPNKPNKWHLKAYCLNCADTGYLSNVFLYKGRDEQRPPGMPATVYPVVKLTEPADYHGKQHCMALDNWYTSIDILKTLAEEPRLMHAVGTVKANRAGLPKTKLFPKTGQNRKERGTIKCYKNVHDGHSTYLTCWMDNKPVHMLSTFPPTKSQVDRNSKDANGRYKALIIDFPTVIRIYNGSMGGTDLKDQIMSYFKSRHKTLNWQNVIFDCFLLVSATNAHVLHRDNSKPRNKQTQLEFMINLIEQWAGVGHHVEIHSEDSSNGEESSVSDNEVEGKRSVAELTADWQGRTTGFHYTSNVSNKDRKSCRVCGKRGIASYCVACKAFVCIDGIGAENCNWRLHNMETFRIRKDREQTS